MTRFTRRDELCVSAAYCVPLFKALSMKINLRTTTTKVILITDLQNYFQQLATRFSYSEN